MKLLNQQIEAIAAGIDGNVGICAIQPESQFQFGLHEQQRFFMASTYKVPIATYCLHLVDTGHLQLSQIISVEHQDLSNGSGILHKYFDLPGISLSIVNLLRLMLEISDNSATDVILRLCGGPAAVTQYLHSLAIKNIDIDTITKEVFADDVTHSPQNTKDTTTPAAMADLLLQIHQRKILSTHSTTFLLNTMQRCQTGFSRIPAHLPKKIKIAQKTGSTSIVTNDIAIIELPEQRGSLILAVYIQSLTTSVKMREQAIALIAKTLYDYILFIVVP